MPRLYDGHGRPVELTPDGIRVDEPLHYQLGIGETAADGDAALAEIRARYGLG